MEELKFNVAINCPMCRKTHCVEVEVKAYEKWQNGELIQNAMPNLSATEREQLISGFCPDCQDKIFGK